MPVRRIKLVGEVGPRSRITRASSGPMALLNSLRPLLLRCVLTAALPAAAVDDSGLEEPRRNFRKSGATLVTLQEKRILGAWCERLQKESGAAAPDGFTKKLQILGSNLASARERCTLPPPPEELELE